MIRKAVIKDINDIMKVIRDTITEMRSYNNTQWNENYPQEKDFINDIKREELFISERDGAVAGFVCINMIEPAEYDGLNWSSTKGSMVVHRMAVDINRRRQGIGMELMNFADELALENNIRYLKTDTYSINTKMQALFEKCNYKFIGEMSFLGKEKPFYCYEKLIIC